MNATIAMNNESYTQGEQLKISCTVIWYNILYQINHVSRILQSPTVSLETLERD